MILGAKAAPEDVATMAELPHVAFVETVLFGKHIAKDRLDATIDAFTPYDDVVVHAPFTSPDGLGVDVASGDKNQQRHSIETWATTMHIADRLGSRKVVLHPGGLAPPGLLRDEGALGAARAAALDRLESALQRLTAEHGRDRILIENMPTQGWYVDHATEAVFLAGVGPADLLGWRDLVAGFVLDTSHAGLTPGQTATVESFIRRLGTSIQHLHVADARIPRGEGLPIGDGELDWDRIVPWLRELDERVTGLTAVPEIMGGHKDAGAGFLQALDWLHDRVVGPDRRPTPGT